MSAISMDSLDAANSSVEIQTAAGQPLSIDGSGFITSNINGTVTVTATDLDIRDLSHTQDSVKIGDGTDFLEIDGSGFITANINGTVSTNPGGLDTWKATNETVNTTASTIATTPLTGRVKMTIQNLGLQDIFIGETGSVTVSTGTKVPKGSSMTESFGDGAAIYALTSASTSDIRVSEYAA